MASAGSRRPSNASSLLTLARSDSFRWISLAENPFESVGTTNPRIRSSVRAHTTATSATDPLVIQSLLPLRTQSPPVSRVAVVRIDAGFDPASASVRPKQPSFSPAAMPGSHSCFCSSLPYAWIAYIASDPCTETKDRRPESTASISWQASP